MVRESLHETKLVCNALCIRPLKITSKGAHTDFAAYDFDVKSWAFATSLFISHTDYDFDQKLQENDKKICRVKPSYLKISRAI